MFHALKTAGLLKGYRMKKYRYILHSLSTYFFMVSPLHHFLFPTMQFCAFETHTEFPKGILSFPCGAGESKSK